MRTERMALSWLSASAAAVCLLTGCPGTLDDKERFVAYAATHTDAGGYFSTEGGVCGDVVARIFVGRCGDTGCHSAASPQQGLDLVSPGVASRVVGVAGQTCSTILADPKNPGGSLLYQKLATKPPCGSQMPLARPPLSGADVACVRAWIAVQ
jgi:hypothetical protein